MNFKTKKLKNLLLSGLTACSGVEAINLVFIKSSKFFKKQMEPRGDIEPNAP